MRVPTKTTEEYKGYGIDYNCYGHGEYSVQLDGDDYMFKSINEAKSFIDKEIGRQNLTDIV